MKASGTDGLTIAERITKPSAALNTIVATIYGRGGVGKTTLLGTMPGRGLVIDVPQVEGGTLVLADKADRIDVLLCTAWKDFRDVYNYLRDEDHGYKWVAIDSITAAQTLAKRKTVNDRDQVAIDPHTITMQDWGKIGELDATLYYSFSSLPLHVIFTAQEKLKDQDDGTREYQPDISPASLAALQPRQMLIGRLYTREVDSPNGPVIERRLRVQPHARAIAKVRTLPSRPVPATIKDPDLSRLFGYLLGAKVKAPEAARDDVNSIGVMEIV